MNTKSIYNAKGTLVAYEVFVEEAVPAQRNNREQRADRLLNSRTGKSCISRKEARRTFNQ